MTPQPAMPTAEVSLCERLLDVLEAESAALFGSADRIESACATLRAQTEWLSEPALARRLPRLARRIAGRLAASNAPIVNLLCGVAGRLPDPWPVLQELFESADVDVVESALAAVTPSRIDERVVQVLASHADRFAERKILEKIAAILPNARALYVDAPSLRVRHLAARILDLDGLLPSPETAARIVGSEAAKWLEPYLAWTRASHLDLLALASGNLPAAIDSLQRAEAICGAKLLRELIGEIGWPQLNLGIEIRAFAGVSIGGSFPLLMTPAEAVLAESQPDAHRVFDRFLAVAHGGLRSDSASPQRVSIRRFREYNLAHADLLAGFLEVAPLTAQKVRDTVQRMDRIVEDFQSLFAANTDECSALADVYGGLKESIERVLAGEVISSELVRLVNMFEDPESISSVRTLHGLKRYLHQRGLKLGMQLVRAGGSTNRTITLTLANAERVLHTTLPIEYADFEADDEQASGPPAAVRLIADELGRQLVHVQQPLPKVKVFCYGNEVHYFIAYRNHPAFVRVDFSPPSRGGMIDLSCYGVSKYELGAHPNPSLTSLEHFFRRLDFDVTIENTHVHARYDKERAFDLADLWAKAAFLFRLAPYLMEIDWVIGDLDLSSSAREEVTRAWAEFFARWGVLPYEQFVTHDRRGILIGVESGPTGEQELRWNGSGPYRDRFSVPAETQLAFEDRILRAQGEIERRHPAERLAEILGGSADEVVNAARVAEIVTVLARGLHFRTVGAINGYDVQSADLPLPGRTLGLHALRDGSGIFRLAIWSEREMWSIDVETLRTLLRRANYTSEWPESPIADAARIVALFSDENPRAIPPPLPGERVVEGVAASPGRAVGPVRLGLEKRRLGDVDGSVVVSPTMTPEDGMFIAASAAVVSTGGGALSHAGLLALQYGKPALLIDGTWERSGALLYRTFRWEETRRKIGAFTLTERVNLHEHEERLLDGDLVVVDTDERVLRILGQEPAALAFHESMLQLAAATEKLARAVSDEEILAERGRRIRALHQLEKVIARLTDPILARHAATELLLGEPQERLLELLMNNPAVGAAARDAANLLTETLRRRAAAAVDRAARLIPDSRFAWEVLSLRHDASGDAHIEDLARQRLEFLRDDLLARAERADLPHLRLLVDQLERIGVDVDRQRVTIAAGDRPSTKRILDASAGGIELRPFIGSKAANLAQVAQLGEGSLVPPWFVVTDAAFREAFTPEVRAAVARTDLTHAQKSSLIREAWDAVELPENLAREVKDAYRRLGDQPFVAVRSSAREEDLESATRAGDFDTFLFVRGEDALIDHLKRAWSGLWSERALHSRALLGIRGEVGGGILVQKMISSRASGVLHTVNVAERRPREMVINAGLGLGEGIVSGMVAADRIVVSKEGDLEHGELQLRYMTADKRQRVVFNRRVGSGTALVETLHHQRLRPALEYVEIRELVRAAARLEAAYGYPLDIEFAVEEASLFLLQVRPIPMPSWRRVR